MDVKESLQGLLTGMGAKLGIPQLSLDAEGSCSLVFDGRITVNLQADPPTGNLIFYSELGRLAEENTDGIYRSLLEANLFWQGTGGGTLAVEPRSRTVLLQYQEALVGMDQVRFEQILDRFVNAAELWGARLAQMIGDTPEPAVDAAAAASDAPSGIRV